MDSVDRRCLAEILDSDPAGPLSGRVQKVWLGTNSQQCKTSHHREWIIKCNEMNALLSVKRAFITAASLHKFVILHYRCCKDVSFYNDYKLCKKKKDDNLPGLFYFFF